MQDVLSDRIVPVPGIAGAYGFRVSRSVGPAPGIDFIDLKAVDDEAGAIESCLARAASEPGYRVHVQGVALAASVARIREWYVSVGCFDSESNRFRIPWASVAVTFGSDDVDTGCAGVPPPKGTYAAKTVRAAFNTGLLCHLRLTPSAPRAKKVRTPEDTVSELLFSEGVSTFALGRALHFNAADRGLASDAYSAVTTDSRS